MHSWPSYRLHSPQVSEIMVLDTYTVVTARDGSLYEQLIIQTLIEWVGMILILEKSSHLG